MLELVTMTKISKLIDETLNKYENELKTLSDEKEAILSDLTKRLIARRKEDLKDLINKHGNS